MPLAIPAPQLIAVVVLVLITGLIFSYFAPRALASYGKAENLWGFIQGGGETGSLDEGYKALHVKIEPDAANPKVYEFHFTNEGALGNAHLSDSIKRTAAFDTYNYFILKNWKDSKCILFTTKYNEYTLARRALELRDYVYYVDSGATIRTDSKSLKGAISGRVSSSGCNLVKDCDRDQPTEFTVCGNSLSGTDCDSEDNDVINQKFGGGTDLCQRDTEGCPSKGCCYLLKQSPDTYTPEYPLLCGYRQNDFASAKWWACSKENTGMSVFTKPSSLSGSGQIQLKCEPKQSGYEWVVAKNYGVNLENANIKYDGTALYHTDLSFAVINYQNFKITDVKVTATIFDQSGIDCDVAGVTTDCTTLGKTFSSMEANSPQEFNSHGLSCAATQGDFCDKAKKFDVKVEYKANVLDVEIAKENNFRVECGNADINNHVGWQKCSVQEIISAAGGANQGTGGAAAGTSCIGAGGQCASQIICTGGTPQRGQNIGTYDCTGDNICCKLA